jgi:hypothetical protein
MCLPGSFSFNSLTENFLDQTRLIIQILKEGKLSEDVLHLPMEIVSLWFFIPPALTRDNLTQLQEELSLLLLHHQNDIFWGLCRVLAAEDPMMVQLHYSSISHRNVVDLEFLLGRALHSVEHAQLHLTR